MRWQIPAINWRKVRLPLIATTPIGQFEEEFGLHASSSKVGLDKEALPDPKPKNFWFTILTTIIILIAATIFFIVLIREYMLDLLEWLASLPQWQGAVLFILLFIAVSLPMMWGYIVLNIASGYLYGIVVGVIITSIGGSIGALVALVLCRRLASSHVHSLLSSYDNLKQIVRVIEGRQGFRIIMMTRLTPVPIGLQNALFSTAKISKSRFFFATILGLLPTQILNAYMGTSLRSIEDILSGSGNNAFMLIIQICMTIGVSWLVNSRMKKEVSKACEREELLDRNNETKSQSTTLTLPSSTISANENAADRFSVVNIGDAPSPVDMTSSTTTTNNEIVVHISPLPSLVPIPLSLNRYVIDTELGRLQASIDAVVDELNTPNDNIHDCIASSSSSTTHISTITKGHRRSSSAGTVMQEAVGVTSRQQQQQQQQQPTVRSTKL